MKRLFTVLFCCIALALTACGTNKTPEPAVQPDKLQVVVSFNAMRELTQAIGGDKVEIHTIVPDGTEPHEFEPKATDLTTLANARVFIMNGMGMEQGWAQKAIDAAGNKDLIVVTAADGIAPIEAAPGKPDPHAWLSLKNAGKEGARIRDALIQADPDNRVYYEGNYDTFQHRLDSLYNEYNSKFSSSPQKIFVTGHAAFAYLARDFGLTQDSLTDVFAAGEPSARHMKELADRCKENHIHVIFVENMENPKIAQTLAHEINATLESLDTLESSSPGKDYFIIMQENLKNIYQSMN